MKPGDGIDVPLDQKILKALEDGDQGLALELCRFLPKDYVIMHQGLRCITEASLACVEEEFARQQKSLAEEIRSSIEKGDYETARERLLVKRKQHVGLHDIHVDYIAALREGILANLGQDAAVSIVESSGGKLRPLLFDPWQEKPVEERIHSFAFTMLSHNSALTVDEDEEKYIFTMDPCGSGGRFLREGAYGPSGTFHFVELGKMCVPSYCLHCVLWFAKLSLAWYGEILWVVYPPADEKQPCTFHVYKDANQVPEEYKKMIGVGT